MYAPCMAGIVHAKIEDLGEKVANVNCQIPIELNYQKLVYQLSSYRLRTVSRQIHGKGAGELVGRVSSLSCSWPV